MATKRDLVMRWYKALETSDLESFQALHHRDVVYDISGHTAISGRHQGLAVLMEVILPVVFAGMNMETMEFCKKVKIMAADEHCVAGIMEVDGLATNGERYDQRYVHFFEFSDDKIVRVVEFFDTALAQDTVLAGASNIPPAAPFTL